MKRFHHRLGWLGISLLMLPVVKWVSLAARDPVRSVFNGAVPRYVLSGKVFSEPFDIVHAGDALDQPTIGKWLFWFTVMTVSSLTWAAGVGWLADRRRTTARIAFSLWVLVVWVCLISILSWPSLWLVQYVCSMGFTERRIFGLAYALAGGCLVTGFLYWAARRPRDRRLTPDSCRNCSYDLTGNVSGVCPECGSSVRATLPPGVQA